MKILIIDDEKWIRAGLRVKLEDYNFETIYEAKNGVEALELIKKHRPEIILTDIRIPKKTGIQVIEEGIKIVPDSIFIIISGYAEFEYAEKGINMGAKGYLLKPIKDDALKVTMDKAIQQLESNARLNNIRSLEKNYALINKEKLLNDFFINHYALDANQLFTDIHKYYALVIINIDASSYFGTQFAYGDVKLIKFSIRNMIEEIVGYRIDHVLYNNGLNKNQLCLLIGQDHLQQMQQFLLNDLHNVHAKISRLLKISITIGVSSIQKTLDRSLHDEAKEAYAYNFIDGRGKIYEYEQVKYMMDHAIQLPKDKIKLLGLYMEKGSAKDILAILESLFLVDKIKDKSTKYLYYLWFEVVGVLINQLEAIDTHHKSLSTKLLLLQSEIFDRFESVDEMINFLYTTIINELKITEDDGNCKTTVEQIKGYIDKNYDENIIIKELAYKYAINPKYLSTLFKKEYLISINKYLTEVRLNKATELLKSTDMNLMDIAMSVGYNDHLYFFRVFKKNYNMTPLEYRQKGH